MCSVLLYFELPPLPPVLTFSPTRRSSDLFYPKTHYRYNPLIFVTVLLALGLINMANMSQILVRQTGITIFVIVLTVVRWGVLSMAMEIILGYYNKQPGRWYGYVLATEVLILPTLATLYWPQVLATPGSLWLLWTLVVQIFGFVRISQQNIFKVFLGYIIYFLKIGRASCRERV